MNKIFTRPEEIATNEQVLYAGNHYLSVPTDPKDPALETRLNENLFFNYFYSVAKDMESDRYLALTSRSPRYYMSGAFWERDCFFMVSSRYKIGLSTIISTFGKRNDPDAQ